MCGDEWTGARIGASTRVWASGAWNFDHPEADPTPPGRGTAVHLLSRSLELCNVNAKTLLSCCYQQR